MRVQLIHRVGISMTLLCGLAQHAAASAPSAFVATNTYTLRSGGTWTDRGAGTKTCTADYQCVSSGGTAGANANLQIACRAPSTWVLNSISIEDPLGGPLVVGGVVVTIGRDPCGSLGNCEVDSSHPAPPGSDWTPFMTSDVPQAPGSGMFEFRLKVNYSPNGSTNGQPVATWVSDNSDVLHGDIVNDAFDEANFPTGDSYCFGDGLDPAVTTACPCVNYGSAGNGCANSVNAAGAHLSATGTTSPDTVALNASGMPATVTSIFIKGSGNVATGVVFGDGVRCAGGTLIRLGQETNSGGMSSYPTGAQLSVSVKGGTPPGSGITARYQTHYRNAAAAFCPPATFNVTSGLTITW